MIELTAEQTLALDNETTPPQVVDPRTQTTYVLIRSDVFQKWQAIVDDGELNMAQVSILVDRALAEDDAHDPTLEFYQREYGRQP